MSGRFAVSCPETPAGPPRHGEPVEAVQPTDWLLNHLTVSGPAGEVARFRQRARGTGAVPWHLDLEAEELRLLAPMAGGGPAARMLARQLREAIARRQDRVLTRWQEPGACPLDLHRLLPVPASILALGEGAPDATAWLRAHWGTTQPLRHGRILDAADRRRRRAVRVTYAFYAADWSPWQAILQLRRDWPRLVFAIVPHYGDG